MRTFIFILFASFALSVFPQSAEGRYHSRITQDGVLFFINPNKIKGLDGLKSFEYDVTLLNWADSVTINFTYESTSHILPTDLKIISGSNEIPCRDYSPLFIDIKKSHYEVRITSKFSNKDFEAIINNKNSPIFSFKQGAEQKYAEYKPKAWIIDKKKLHDIFQLYQYSK